MKDNNASQPWTSELRWYYQHFHWGHFGFLVLSLISIPFIIQHVPLTPKTFLMSALIHPLSGMTISAGYHRLWSHRSYKACVALRYFFAIVGAGQCQWSIMWWVRHHRAHHQYTDTRKDPYNARRGFLFSHIGWLISYNPKEWGEVDLSDLTQDPVVVWQQRYYAPIAILISVVFPVTIAHYGWNDGLGGFIYLSFVRLAIQTHVTFLINSLAHASWAGSQPYSNTHTARNVPFLALIAGGEGSHNFHHTFPGDYRSGIDQFDSDLAARFIQLCEKLGLASNLRTTSPSEVEKARQHQAGQTKQPTELADTISDVRRVPTVSRDEFTAQAAAGRSLVCIDGFIYDVTEFMADHPGGYRLIQDVIGKDATNVFYNGLHAHSPHAETILYSLRTATLRDMSL